MKLHLPARLRSALLACLSLVAPLSGTLATGCLVAGTAAVSLSVAHAAEITVNAGETVAYDSANTYVLNGGTLDVSAGTVAGTVTVGAANSTILLGDGAELSPLRVSLAEGVQSYKLAGTGTFVLGSVANMYGADVSDWNGTVSITQATNVSNLNLNNYGNSNSKVLLSGVVGWLGAATYLPTVLLEDVAGNSALKITNGVSNSNYVFSGVRGSGTLERGGSWDGDAKFSFLGDVSEWTGKILNNSGKTTLIFGSYATEINLESITHNNGHDLNLQFDGANATVVKSLIQSVGEGAINLTVNNSGGVTFAGNAEVASLSVSTRGSMTVASGAQMTVQNAAALSGEATVDGTLSLNGGGSLGATIVNNGTLNLFGTFTVDSSGLDRTLVGDCSFTDGENGYQTKGSVKSTVVKNSSDAKLNAQGASFTFDGTPNVKLSDDGTVTTVVETQGSVYWVRKDIVSYAATGATAYGMAGADATLVLDNTNAGEQGSALIGIEGSEGTVRITEDTTLTGDMSSKATCDLVVSGKTLRLGGGEAQSVSISSFSSVTLENNALIRIESQSDGINNLTVAETGGRINVVDAVNVPSTNPYVFNGITTLNGTLTRDTESNKGWGNGMRFVRLSGAGSLVYVNNPYEESYVAIDSLEGFTGSLSFTQTNDVVRDYDVKINSGAAPVKMDTLTIGCINKAASFRNMNVELTASKGLEVNELEIRSNTNLNIYGASGLSASNIVVHGVDNLITVRDDSALNLSALNVTASGVLSVEGNVSALAMNQAGALNLADMRLVDGASLIYAADANVLHIAGSNLLGKVNVDLNSLTNAQTLAIVNNQGLDLGIDKNVGADLIGVVADNIRDAKLDNSGDTWKLVSGVVSQYWEAAGGTGNWNTTDANWAFRDGATADSAFVGGTDAIFSGHAGAEVTITETVDVQNLEIRSGYYTFKGDIVVKNDLVVQSDNNFFVGNVTVEGKLRGEGYLGVNGDLKLGKSSEICNLFMPSGTVIMTGTNTPSESNTDLTITGTASCNGLENVGKLTVTEGASMTVTSTSATSIGSLAGEGSVTANSGLILKDGESSIGTLTTTGGLTLGKTATLKVGTLGASVVTAELGSAVVAGKTILDVTNSNGDITMTVAVKSLDDLSKLTNGATFTMAAVSQGGDVSGLWNIDDIKSDSAVTLNSNTEFTVVKDNRGFVYELTTSDDNKTITLQVTRTEGGWIGLEDGIWSNTSGAEWSDNLIPGDKQAAAFFGKGSSVVKVDEAGVSTVLVDVDISADSELKSYTFTGGTVNAGGMTIGQGELIIANTTEVKGNTEVYSNGKLTIADGGHMEVGRMNAPSNLSLTDNATLTLETDAVLTVSGTLSAEEGVTITNSGMLSAGEVSIAGSMVNGGTLQIAAGGTIDSIEGGSLYAMLNEADTLKMGSANVSSLQIGTTGSTVELSEDSVIGTLYSNVEGTSLTSTAKLTLSEAAFNQGGVVSVTAKSLTLNKIGNEFGTLSAPEIILDLKDSVLSAVEAAVSVESIVAVDPVQIHLTKSTIESLPVDADNVLAADDYLLIKGVGGYSADDFIIADSVMQEIKRRGVTAEVLLEGDALLLSLGVIDDGMIWDTTNGNMVTNNGYEVPDGEGLYTALDYVEQVIVSDNKTIDLTAQGVGNADAMATIPQVGIIIRNPDGGGTLTLVGDEPTADGTLPDVATLIAKDRADNPVTLIGKSIQVNIGLPVGTEAGILASDADSDKMVLAAAEMREGSALLVNRDTEVVEATELREGSSLIVANGAVLSTGMLTGEADATVTGRVNIESMGGIYHGSYGDTGAEVEFSSGAYQTIRAGKGLSLRVAGGEGILDFADEDSEMSSLGVGAGFTRAAASGSELVIRNTTLNEDADRVEHHTLKLTESENFVSSSELTVSLGAAETAETLGTDNAPVIMDGSVRIENSDICLKMETTKDNLRALNVNPNAPMIGAKLATLVTDGNVSADNEVEFVGAASLLNVVKKYYTNARLSADGDVLVDRVTDYYASKAGGMSETGSVGLEMLDKVLVELNPQNDTQNYQDLANVLNALDDAVVAGNTAEADKLAASVTGASAAALGAALAGDMERQLRAIRNRTTTMGVDQSTVNHNMPYFNAWINAEYDNRKLDEDGTLSGYDYSVTGGTVGFDVDVTPRFVCGLALSALTGDMSSEGPDELEADVDSYYLTAFARTTYRRWTHTFVASVGKSDLSIDRTVSFSGGNYRTKGETEATSFGFMYELGYVFALDADATTCLQPVLNVSVAHSSMDGYTESGSDAALEIGSVDMTTVTIGMGARLQSVVGQNIFNRASIFESRALIKVNAGDRDAEVDTALTALPAAAGKVSCAERGPISLEIGAGITVPIGSRSGSIFLDGSAELGAEYTGVNATVGYRLNF